MAKAKKVANTEISTQEDFLKMVDSLSAASSNNSRTKLKVTLKDIPSLDTSKLQGLAESIYLSGVNIEVNLLGDVGVNSAALLNRRFKRTGFAGRNINLAIPATVEQQQKVLLTDRICQCVKSEFLDTIKSLIQKGETISMAKAKEIGLIDQVIDLSKRRGAKTTTGVAASDDNTVVENQTTTT